MWTNYKYDSKSTILCIPFKKKKNLKRRKSIIYGQIMYVWLKIDCFMRPIKKKKKKKKKKKGQISEMHKNWKWFEIYYLMYPI